MGRVTKIEIFMAFKEALAANATANPGMYAWANGKTPEEIAAEAGSKADRILAEAVASAAAGGRANFLNSSPSLKAACKGLGITTNAAFKAALMAEGS